MHACSSSPKYFRSHKKLARPGANNELYYALLVHLTGHTVKDQKMG